MSVDDSRKYALDAIAHDDQSGPPELGHADVPVDVPGTGGAAGSDSPVASDAHRDLRSGA
jgi:hypothetical protein